jgi:hypothetical protein
LELLLRSTHTEMRQGFVSNGAKTQDESNEINNWPSRAGLAVRAWLVWITSDYAVEPIWQGLTAGLFQVANGRGSEAAPASRVARVLRKAGIGWGLDRYRPRLEQMLACSGGGSLEEDTTNSGAEWRTRTRQEVKATLDVCEALIGLVPAPDPESKFSVSHLAAGARQLLEDWVSVKSAEEASAAAALPEVFAGLAALELPPVPATDALGRLREILGSTRIASMPRAFLHADREHQGTFTPEFLSVNKLGVNGTKDPSPLWTSPAAIADSAR